MASEASSQAGSLELSEGTDSTYDPQPSSSEPLSIIQPLSYSASSCGYCAEEKGTRSKRKQSKSYGCWAHVLSCQAYKDLIDRGWRRSGAYLYKPDMRATCCPQYTISLDAINFKSTKSHRQLLTRFNNHVMFGARDGERGWGPGTSKAGTTASAHSSRTVKSDSALSKAVAVNFTPKAKPVLEEGEEDVVTMSTPRGSSSKATKRARKGKQAAENAPRDLSELMHAAEWQNSPADAPFKHRFEYIVEPASFTEEKFALFKQYQTQIHGEPESKVTKRGFTRFLVDTPLVAEAASVEGISYGSHHGLYRLDGKLIAFAVLDILPGAVSSVYFVWDSEYSGMALGKISALREIAMVREYAAQGLSMNAYMMGYFILKCPKMKYKAEYQPSYLLDPDTNEFYPYEKCAALLEQDDRASFSGKRASNTSAAKFGGLLTPGHGSASASSTDVEDDDDDVPWPDPPPPGCLHPDYLPRELLLDVCAVERNTLVPLMFSQSWHDEAKRREVKICLAALGEAMAGRIALWMG